MIFWLLAAFFAGVGVTQGVICVVYSSAIQQPPKAPPSPRPSPPLGRVRGAEVKTVRVIYHNEQPD